MLRFAHALLGAALLFSSAGALAAPGLVPPAPLAPLVATYPAGETQAAHVVADVVVDRDGNVVRIEVLEGDPPFADAARAASPTWRFAPATRDGAPVPARIRARIDFDAPQMAVIDAPPPGALEAPAPVAPAEEVRVRAPVRGLGRVTLTAQEVRTLPGAFGEPARAIESLPGVAPYVSGLPFVSVRGAMPSATSYTLDGMRLPVLFHYGLGVTALHPALIESMDLFTGATPARDGRAFSVIELTTRRPADRPHGELAIRAIDSSLLVETPIADGRGSILVAGRYGYPGPIVRALDSRTHLSYANYQLRATWRLGERHTLTLLGLGIHDEFADTAGGISSYLTNVDAQVHRLDLRYDARIGDTGAARVAVTLGRDRMYSLTTIDRVQGRGHVDLPLGPTLRIRGGVDAESSTYDGGPKVDPASQNVTDYSRLVDSRLTSDRAPRTAAGLWVDAVWRPSRAIEIVPGVRVDRYDGTYEGTRAIPLFLDPEPRRIEATIVSPRLATRVRLAPWVDVISNIGTGSKEPIAAFPTPGADFVTAATSRRVQQATMLDIGVEARAAGMSIRAVGFENNYRNANLWPILTQGTLGVFDTGPQNAHADGRAHGAEIILRKASGGRFEGWLSYTLTFARMHAPGAPEFDDPLARRHVLNGVAGYDLGGGVRVGARAVFYSGAPFATTTSFNSDNTVAVTALTIRDERPAAFWRVDVRLEKRWRLSPTASVAIAIDWLNATLNRETEVICRTDTFFPEAVPPQCIASKRPLLSAPSLMIEGSI